MNGSLNVKNWLVVGIGHERRLCDRFKWLNEVIEAMLIGIGLERWLHERSRVSSPCIWLQSSEVSFRSIGFGTNSRYLASIDS